MSKAKVVVTENILLFKYQKQVRIEALNGEDVAMLLPTAFKKLWIYQVLPFKFTLLRKNENSSEKKQFHWSIFFKASRNPVRKRKVSKTKVVI